MKLSRHTGGGRRGGRGRGGCGPSQCHQMTQGVGSKIGQKSVMHYLNDPLGEPFYGINQKLQYFQILSQDRPILYL